MINEAHRGRLLIIIKLILTVQPTCYYFRLKIHVVYLRNVARGPKKERRESNNCTWAMPVISVLYRWNTFNRRYFIRFLNFSCISSSIANISAALLIFLISGCFVVFVVLFFRAFLILFLLFASFLCFNWFMLNWTSSISLAILRLFFDLKLNIDCIVNI
ncbi:Uncharacterized protein FWK35_00023284 [Aphis craccivora]|uniref:Uncharacterized protein n=1 Tax=Aphis craccivora TaxID=307492 RepID=A0A6G0Y7X8_APHCR|nr:Uncharacterized protein FWK35_00023284 [Aphis craccivora]